MTSRPSLLGLALLRLALLGLASFAAGCNLNLDSPTLVKTPRILAIVAEPPEVHPGDDVEVSVLAFDPMGRDLTYAFEVCLDPSALLASSSFDPDDATCFPMVADGFRATLPGSQTMLITTALDMLTPEQIGGFPIETLRAVLATAGIPVRVQVDVIAPDGTVLVSGHKLVGITTRAEPTTNPPPAALFVDGQPYSAGSDADRPFECTSSRPVTVTVGSEVPLQPARNWETWIETFPIFDYTGNVRTGSEGAYYSWYANGGSMPEETTQVPREGTRWRAPDDPGTYRLWFVVRDGHLGTAACTFELEVVADGV